MDFPYSGVLSSCRNSSTGLRMGWPSSEWCELVSRLSWRQAGHKADPPSHLSRCSSAPRWVTSRWQDRTTLRAWEGHGCCQGLPTLVDNIPSEANLLQVKTIQSAPPGVHWESSFGMSEARRLKGRPEVNNAKGGTRTSRQGSWPAALGTNTPSISLLGRGRC